MNIPSSPLDLRLTTLLQKVRDEQDDQAQSELNALLRTDAAARRAMAVALVNEQAIISELRDQSIVSILNTDSAPTAAMPKAARWFAWRPLTAAAAGIVFGMLCTSVVFGFVSQRAAVKKMPLVVFDSGLEDVKQTLNEGLPSQSGQWGMDDAQVVPAEGKVTPLIGQHMLRLQPIPREKNVKNHTSRAYQVLDLRSLPTSAMTTDTEVEVSASFCPTNSGSSSRYLIRAIALDEAPAQATKNFWSKVESDGVVSESQRFDCVPGAAGWHMFSMTLRLPPGSKTLVLILGAVPPEDADQPASAHYLDDVHVSLLSSENPLP